MADFSTWAATNRALWTRLYDEIITPQLEEEWKKRDEKHKSELRDKDEHISKEVATNKRLRDENEHLRERLHAQGQDTGPFMNQENIIASNTSSPTNDYHHLTEKYNELSKKYRDTSQKLKYLERKNDSVMQKNREMKEGIRAWQEYCDRQYGRQKPKTETKAGNARTTFSALSAVDDLPSSPKSAAFIRTPQHLVESEDLSPTPRAPVYRTGETTVQQPTPRGATQTPGNKATTNVEPLEELETLEHGQHVNDDIDRFLQKDSEDHARISHSSLPGPHGDKPSLNIPSSSQTTEDESAEQNAATAALDIVAEDDDTPILVSERSLKRKRDPSTLFDIYTDRPHRGTPGQPIRIKEEQRSSPPPAFHPLQRKETVDLDEPGPHLLATPRRRDKRKKSVHSNLTGTLQHQRSSSAPFTQCIKRENSQEYHLVTVDNGHTPHRTTEQESAIVEARALSAPINTNLNRPNILQPLDPNILEIKSEETSNKRFKRLELHRQQNHDMLVESSESVSFMNGNKKRLTPNLARIQFNRKLQASKDTTTQTPISVTARSKAELLPTPQSSTSHLIDTPSDRSRFRQRPLVSRSDSPSDSTTDVRPVWRMQPLETQVSSRKVKTSAPERQVPLRSKPLDDLSVQDFKPNPIYNQGYSFAFSETVRRRGDRMCLPGCTNSLCCGSAFRTLASAAPPLSSSQEEKLLEDYLGDAYDNMRLTQMASEEREELVLQARTRMMAKDHGKHRQAYEGRRTPPGYWRIDFPSTQEQQEDRKKAKEQERSIVQDRWMEAMRKGGRWIFRDE